MMQREMVRGGFDHKDPKNDDYRFKISDDGLLKICQSINVSKHIAHQQSKYMAHIIRCDNKINGQQETN